MVAHTCEKCGKIFNKKSTYINHIDNKKKPCITIPIISCDILQTPVNSCKLLQKSIIKNKYICNFCDKSFTRIDNFKVHLEKRCKTRKEENKDKEEIFIKLLENHKEEIKFIIKEKDEQINKLASEIKILKTQKEGVYKKVINDKSTNNKSINNGIINNTINIIQHGKEDLSKIDNNVFFNALLKYTGQPTVANSINTI